MDHHMGKLRLTKKIVHYAFLALVPVLLMHFKIIQILHNYYLEKMHVYNVVFVQKPVLKRL